MAHYSPSEDRARLLGEWVRKCDELHGSKCHLLTPMAERLPRHVPDWVIDTERGCIVPGKSVDKYAALSYVWSSPVDSSDKGPTDRLLLQRENLQDLQTPGYLSTDSMVRSLPKVIRDSIILTSQSGTRYLWVDCLCVIQHDHSTDGKMDSLPEIYSGAFFTIIAAAKDNGLHGSMSETRTDTETMSVSSLHGELLASHWATRGWTFQEHLLSKRSIIFLDRTMFWDCQCSVWWARDEADRKQDSRLESKANDQQLIQLGDSQEEKNIGTNHDADRDLYQQLVSLSTPDFSLYRELVCRYNHRNLTFGQDALRAFSGVLDSFARGFYGGFVSGLPTLFLDSVLLWQPLRKAKRRIATPNVQHVAPPSPLPSWSWAGWQCLVDPRSLESCLDYLVDLSPDGSTSQPRGTWTTSNLDVEWQAMNAKDDISHRVMDGPVLLQYYKKFQAESYAQSLPSGWFSRIGLERYPIYDHTIWGLNDALISWEERQVTWFSHGSRDGPFYKYPLPMRAASSADTGPGDASFLSCITTTAEFRIRRVMFPRPLRKSRFASAFSVSVLDTDLYNEALSVDACCPVITLEDCKGRWAGLMRIMDDSPGLRSAKTIKAVAISRGSCSNLDAALTYEAVADRGDFCVCGPSNRSVYLNDSSPSAPAPGDLSFGPLQVTFSPAPDENSGSDEDEDEDKGPIYPPRGCWVNSILPDSEGVPEGWREQTYEFYNVLWVEQRDGIMYRKAAGRISKEIWEKNCGEKQRIVLG